MQESRELYSALWSLLAVSLWFPVSTKECFCLCLRSMLSWCSNVNSMSVSDGQKKDTAMLCPTTRWISGILLSVKPSKGKMKCVSQENQDLQTFKVQWILLQPWAIAYRFLKRCPALYQSWLHSVPKVPCPTYDYKHRRNARLCSPTRWFMTHHGLIQGKALGWQELESSRLQSIYYRPCPRKGVSPNQGCHTVRHETGESFVTTYVTLSSISSYVITQTRMWNFRIWKLTKKIPNLNHKQELSPDHETSNAATMMYFLQEGSNS